MDIIKTGNENEIDDLLLINDLGYTLRGCVKMERSEEEDGDGGVGVGARKRQTTPLTTVRFIENGTCLYTKWHTHNANAAATITTFPIQLFIINGCQPTT